MSIIDDSLYECGKSERLTEEEMCTPGTVKNVVLSIGEIMLSLFADKGGWS